MSAQTKSAAAKNAAATKAQVEAHIQQRRASRKPLSVPVEITVLRSGIPCSMPGRSLNLSEVGVGIVLAGELPQGDPVGLELRLPNSDEPLYIKAVVRYQGLLCCGLEFVGLSAEQQTAIRNWAGQTARQEKQLPVAGSQLSAAQGAEIRRPTRRRSVLFAALWVGLVVLLVVGGLGWWRWRRTWHELESRIPASQSRSEQPRVQVPGDVMAKLITHKIEPVYPEGARQAQVQGVVVLDAVIGRDGSVVDLHAISGPDELAAAAVDAVKWWRFEPYRVNGQAVQVETTLAVDFRQN